MATGIPLGVLVGFFSGAAFIICVWAATRDEMLKATSAILAIPASCFSGGWLTTLFKDEDILSSYVAALSVTTVIVGSYTLFRLIVRVSHAVDAPG